MKIKNNVQLTGKLNIEVGQTSNKLTCIDHGFHLQGKTTLKIKGNINDIDLIAITEISSFGNLNEKKGKQ